MKSTSFAGRLSKKIILITSVIFVVAIASIAVRSSLIAKQSAIEYSAQKLLTSSKRIESTLDEVKQLTVSMAKTIEAYNHNGYQLDTANFFPLLQEIVTHNQYLLGCGVYFEPYTYNKRSRVAGIYVSKDPETGETEIEWDDDAIFAIDGWDYFDNDWYKKAIASGKPLWIPPFIEYMVSTEYNYMTTYSVPLKDKNGKPFGVCSFDLSLNWLKDELLSMRPFTSSNVMIVDQVGDFICDPLSETPFEGNLFDDPYLKPYNLSGNVMESMTWEDRDQVKSKNIDVGAFHLFCVGKVLNNGWIMIISSQNREAFRDVAQIWILLIVIAVLGLVILFFVSKRIIHREAHPLVEFAKAAGKITDGRFDIPIPEVKYEDEISELGNALRYMQTSVTRYIEELTITTSEKERLAGELDVARKIQKQMLCTAFPSFDDHGIFATSIPAKQVGGDLYDFSLRGDDLFFVIADVSGKSVPAALLMSISISAFRAAVRHEHTMDDLATIINRVFCMSNEDMMFLTAVVGCINLKTGKMDVCNAGHNPMVLISPNGEASFVQLKNNLVCGIMSDFKFEAETMTLEKGSRLVIYTDGVTEAEDKNHGQFGEERLLEFCRNHGTSKVGSDEQVVNELSGAVSEFVADAEQFDDITIMSISI